jgi:hypothetical protein
MTAALGALGGSRAPIRQVRSLTLPSGITLRHNRWLRLPREIRSVRLRDMGSLYLHRYITDDLPACTTSGVAGLLSVWAGDGEPVTRP